MLSSFVAKVLFLFPTDSPHPGRDVITVKSIVSSGRGLVGAVREGRGREGRGGEEGFDQDSV